MSDIKHSGPGDPGSQQGQIKTPMCSGNVANKGGGKTHDFSNTMNLNAAGPGKGNMKTDDSIKGPGVKGQYPNKGRGKG